MILKLTSKQAHMLIQKGHLKDRSMTMKGKSAKVLAKHIKSNK